MRIDVIPFDPKAHLDAAAELLAQRQRRVRLADDRLPAAFEDRQACRRVIEAVVQRADARGVLAEADGEPAGYAFMWPFLPEPTEMPYAFFPPRTAHIGYAEQCAREDVAFDVYRAMYGALAGEYVRRGIFDHVAYISPHDRGAHDAYVSLGFGRMLVAAMRDTTPVESQAADGVRVDAAGAEDASVIIGLNEHLWEHHTASPIFWPMLREPLAAEEEFTRALLQDPETNAHFVAYRDGQPLGMNTFMKPDWVSELLRDDKTVYLYQGVVAPEARGGGIGQMLLERGMAWAREQGYEHAVLHFWAPNISGARFWLGMGFRPIEYRMTRHIDERIAWANGVANAAASR